MFDESFICDCPRKCTSLVSLELRKRLFNQFHSMGTFNGRCAHITGCVSKPISSQANDRAPDRRYSMFGFEVCRAAFLRTLQISESRVTTALEKQKKCDTYSDGRGKTSGGHNALPPSKRREVIEHIDSFPRYISHYTRNQTDAKFLNSELNLSKMYELYKLKFDQPASKSYYKKIFYNEFDLRFKVPKQDTCYKCDVYIIKMKTASGPELILLEKWHKEHLEQAESLRSQMNKDLKMAKSNPTIETLTTDQQKTQNCPKVPTGIAYYKRSLNLYNQGIHVGSTGQGRFNIWLEHEASKGTQEVGSCLKKFIDNIAYPVEELLLWSDSCGGQNRSIKLVLMMIYILQNHRSLETISLRYLLPGHSFLPNDSDFGDAERPMKKIECLYTDTDYTKAMKKCRTKNKFHVQRMHPEDFLSTKKLENAITNRKVDINKKKVSWLDTHEILLEKSQPFIIKMRNKIDGDFQCVDIKKRGPLIDFKDIELENLWPNGRVLSTEKINDLKQLLKLVPDKKKNFYSFLETVQTRDFMDDVDGYGEFVDFELEFPETS